MRIGLLIYGSLETISGGYLYDRKLIDNLIAQGDQVEIISFPWRNYPRHLFDNFSTALLTRLEKIELDVLLQDELNHPSLFWLNHRLRSKTTYPLVAIVHHLRCSEKRPSWQNWLYSRVERGYLHTLDGFIFNSQTTRQTVATQGIDLSACPNVVATPAGDHLNPDITQAEIKTRAATRGPLRLLFIGNLISRKGLHHLLDALIGLARQDWHLTAIGNPAMDTPYTRSIRQKIAAGQLSANVDLVGKVSQGELTAHLKSSHVLVVPSSYEGYGIVYLEAMGYGLPAIAGREGAAGEIITHGQDGYLVPFGDAATLQGYLIELANNRALLSSMGLAARRRYLAQPTWQQSANKIRAFLLELCRTDMATAC